MSFKTCCVINCFVKLGDGISLHRFPNPDSQPGLFEEWVTNIGGEIRTLDPNFVYRNRRVCHKHFNTFFYGTKNRLTKNAVPSLDLPGAILEQDNMQVDSFLGSSPVASTSYMPVKASMSTSEACTYTHKGVVLQQSGSLPKQEVNLNNLIVALKKQVKRNKLAKCSYKQRFCVARKTMKNEAMKLISAKMSKMTKTFLAMQIKEACKKPKGRRFSLKEKILALSLYKPSPKAYKVLSEICALPQRKTLNNLLQKIPLKPGDNEFLFSFIRNSVKKLPEHHRYCTLIFDEMAIAPGLTYDKKNDEIIGFVDNGEEKLAELADHVLVFMVRGVIKKFKQPVSYSFCNSTTKTGNLVVQIENMIKKIQDCGLEVVATLCDQGATNIAAINILLNKTRESYLRKGKEYKGGFFEINSKKVVPIYDPPHLIKGVRNNFIDKDLKYVLKNKEHTAKWQHIVDFYKRAPGYSGKRLVPKLTAHRVLPHLIPKMRVKHCTQVFSNSVGVALGFMADAGKLPEESKDTADLLLFFDSLFDSVNGSSSQVGGKIYRTAITPTSPHHKLWRDSIPVLKSMKFIKDGKTTVVPSLINWVKTIEGFQILVKELYKKGHKSILLRNFNQDPLENFFGAIRVHGGQNTMPNAAAFTSAFKTLLINNMTSPHSVGANCEKDNNASLIKNLEKLFYHSSKYSHTNKKKTEEIIEDHLIINEVDINTLITSQSIIEIERCAALGYCSGWLVSKARKIYRGCGTCKKNLESDFLQEFHKYIKVCEYSEKQWLCYPTKEAFNFFVQIENIVREVIKTSSPKKNIAEYIKLICSIHLNMFFMQCDLHKELIIDFMIHKSVQFNLLTWCKHINKILSHKEINFDINDAMQNKARNYCEKRKLRRCRKI